MEVAMGPIKPKIAVDYAEKATVITFAEEKILEEEDIRALQESIMSVVEQAGGINLVLDFVNVRFLSSAVLGLLIRVSKKVYEGGGQLRLCSIAPKIHEIFKITRLTKIFEIHRDLESAVESLSGSD
jgi:anti-sigma B factor antagonist